jgi:hypothetical protein
VSWEAGRPEGDKTGKIEGGKVRRLGGWKDRRKEDKKVKRLRPGIPKERERFESTCD